MDSRASRWSSKTLDLLSQVDVASQVSSLLPQLITEMETLRALSVDRRKPEEEQKKQAGFIQQRKRARLNELFKTLQRLGFSYRFGVTNFTDINNYDRACYYGYSGEPFEFPLNVSPSEWENYVYMQFRTNRRRNGKAFRFEISILSRLGHGHGIYVFI